ncbi:hypothetical protein KKF32_00345 [Patescibacteria group bacterium]|nr:hypothetical protein [Patescibacteria group bacterium]
MPKKIASQRGSKVVDLRKLRGEKSSPQSGIKRPSFAARKISSISSMTGKRIPAYSSLARTTKGKGKPLLVFLIILFILLISAAIFSFFVFYQDKTSGESVKLSLKSPKELSSGEEFKMQLIYENRDRITLEKIEAVVQYPEGFFFNSSNLKPSGSQNNIWRLPDLEPGQGGKIEISGQLVGKIDEAKEFKATFYYQPTNFNSNFKSELLTTIKINDVLFDVIVEKPEVLSLASMAEFKVKYQNTTTEEMGDLFMSFDLGNDFTVISSSPSTTQDILWKFEKIEAKQEGEINLQGKFAESLTGEVSWLFKVWQNILHEGERQQRLLYQEEEKIQIVTPDLQVNLAFSDSDELSWGGNLDCHLSIENNGLIKAENAFLKVKFDTSLIDWSKFNNQTFAQRDRNTLNWSQESGEFGKKLSEILPQNKIELVFSVPLKEKPSDLDVFTPEDLIIVAEAILNYKTGEKTYSITSEPLTTFLGVQPQLLTEARYYLDEQTAVGSGPLPPVVGQETKYRIYWKAFSGSRALEQLKIKASLPPYINWVQQADDATINSQFNYQEENRQVIWQIESLAPNTQVSVSFDISVVPDSSHFDQLLVLINPTSLQAKEQGNDLPVFIANNLLTSELSADPVASGKGRVKAGN